MTADLADRAGEEIVGLGNGVTLAVSVQTGRPTGSSVEVQIRFASIQICEDGLIVWMKNYNEIDENRAAAERALKAVGLEKQASTTPAHRRQSTRPATTKLGGGAVTRREALQIAAADAWWHAFARSLRVSPLAPLANCAKVFGRERERERERARSRQWRR